jgi:hypothetical protein
MDVHPCGVGRRLIRGLNRWNVPARLIGGSKISVAVRGRECNLSGKGEVVNNKLMADLLEHGQDLRGSTLAVMQILVYYSNADRVCWPRVSKLAKHSHLKRRQVHYILDELIELGYVTREKRTGHQSHLYRLTVPGLPDVENPVRRVPTWTQ